MKIHEFERMMCDSLNDTIDNQEPTELYSKLHFVDTLKRLNIEETKQGLLVILNDGSMFTLEINVHKRVDM